MSTESVPHLNTHSKPLQIAAFGALLIVLNLLFFALASRVPDIPLTEWRKGPPIHGHSLYGPIRGPRTFWVFTALLLDAYFLILVAYHGLGRYLQRLPRAGTAICLALAVLSLAFTEGTLRVYRTYARPGHFRPHPDFFYWNARGLRNSLEFPDGAPESTNSLGFRGPEEIPTDKAAGEYRVFVVGDSSAFGHGVADDETFAEQLEKILARRLGRPVRVVNGACPGHCTYEGLKIFRTMGLPLKPDLLIVSYNNDASPEYVEEKMRDTSGPLAGAIRRVLYRSDYYLLFQRTVQNALLSLRYDDRENIQPPVVPRVSPADYRSNLQAFVDLARAKGSEVLFLKMPVNYDLIEKDPRQKKFYNPDYPRSLVDLAREKGYHLVDVDRHVLDTAPDSVFLFGHHFHPSPDGHRLIAELAARKVEEMLGGAGARVRLGYSTLTPLHAAVGEVLARTDILARHGLEADFLRFEHGRDQDRAQVEGLVDVTFSCEVPAMIHLDRHPDLMITGSPGSLGEIALVAPVDSTITSLTDLRGGAVAVAAGASAQMALEQWLGQEGLEPFRDVRLTVVDGGEAAVRLLQSGGAAAAVLWDPWLTRIFAEGKIGVLKKTPFWSLLIFSERWQAPPEVRSSFVEAVGEALAWAGDHRGEVARWVSRGSGLAESVVTTVLEKNRHFGAGEAATLLLGQPVKQRLEECAQFARREQMTSESFDLKGRIRALSPAPADR